MPKFFNHDLAELTHQLSLSPRRLRKDQILGIEHVLSLVDPARAYPYDFVCFHITKYQKKGTSSSIPGDALICDMVTMAEVLSRKAGLTTAELGLPFRTHQQVAEQLKVSTKTIRRWRDRGLMGIRLQFEDGVSRLAFLQETVDRFVRQNQELVAKGASFTQLTDAERKRIVERARTIIARRRVKLHAAARMIAEETGRAVETIRYTLRRFDESNPAKALFNGRGDTIHSEQDLAVCRCLEAGNDVATVADRLGRSEAEVSAAVRRVQLQRWAQHPPECIFNELFDAPNADALILDAPEPACESESGVRIPRDLPAYLQSLYLTPLLGAELERDLFRRYNYLKHKAARLLKDVDTEEATAGEFEQIEQLLQRAEAVKQRIVQANLRLVVSIAKKHVGWSGRFFELISDGNISLLRAVEKFDFALGNKFSTYASWAIMKNFARSIPEQQYHAARYVTGQDELLDAAAARHDATAGVESDRRRVRELLCDSIGELDEREREIIRGHYGLGGTGESLTLEQLGSRFGVTKERIRQIEQRAIARLREVLAPSLAESLSD